MLKFQENYNIATQSFEDFILVIFVLIDDFYKKVVPDKIKFRRNVDKALLSDSEIIPISICGELLGIDSEKAWDSFLKKNYRHLFPKMCDRSQFNRTRRNLLQVTNLIFSHVAKYFQDNLLIVDSFELEVCKFGRANFCKCFKHEGATYSYNPSKKQTFFGYKVHVLTTESEAVKFFEITSANVDDRVGLEDFSDSISIGSTIIGDKGYVSEMLKEFLSVQGKKLLALQRDNFTQNYPTEIRRMIFKIRRRIETVFSQATDQLNIERVRAKSFRGLCIRLLFKFLAFNLCLMINISSNFKSLIF